MEKTNFKLKTKVLNRAVFITALLFVAGVLFTGCPQRVKEEPKPVYYTVSLVHEGGSLTVNPVLQGGKALKDSVITFTASPANASTHEVDKWEITGGTKISGGEDGSISVKVKITANTTVKVTFKLKPVYYTVSLVHEGGSLTVNPVLQGGKALKDSVITFTASPANASTHEVDKWEITGGHILEGGEDGSASVKVKITANTTVKVTFKPIDKTYTVGSVEFTMKGIASVKDAPLGHDDHNSNKPHTVSLSDYLIGETEVTQELWQVVMGNNPSEFDGSSGKEPAVGETQGKRPVENVNWYHAIAFCNKLSIKLGLEPCYTVRVGGTPVDFANLSFNQIPTTHNTDWDKAELNINKKGFRLPTEAEWEWAAKGGKDYKWAGTNTEAELKNYAWYGLNSGSKTHEVKKRSPNGYGLYDMSGNVFEWCWDWYGTLPASPGADYTGAASGFYRVIRGGSWIADAGSCAVGRRNDLSPFNRSFYLGIRLACRPYGI